MQLALTPEVLFPLGACAVVAAAVIAAVVVLVRGRRAIPEDTPPPTAADWTGEAATADSAPPPVVALPGLPQRLTVAEAIAVRDADTAPLPVSSAAFLGRRPIPAVPVSVESGSTSSGSGLAASGAAHSESVQPESAQVVTTRSRPVESGSAEPVSVAPQPGESEPGATGSAQSGPDESVTPGPAVSEPAVAEPALSGPARSVAAAPRWFGSGSGSAELGSESLGLVAPEVARPGSVRPGSSAPEAPEPASGGPGAVAPLLAPRDAGPAATSEANRLDPATPLGSVPPGEPDAVATSGTAETPRGAQPERPPTLAPCVAAGSSPTVAAAVAQALAVRAAAGRKPGEQPPVPNRTVDARDRLLAVLLADPVRAVGAAEELATCRGQVGDVLARLGASGLSTDQLARLSGFSVEQVTTLLDQEGAIR